MQRALLTAAYPKLRDTPLVHVRHHLAHAASAYYLIGFDEALGLVADGMGETDSITVFHGIGAHLIRRATHPIGSSLGILYGALTHYLGFLFDDLFVRPAAGDMERPRRGPRRVRHDRPAPPTSMTMPYWGEDCDPAAVAQAVQILPRATR